MAEPMAKRKCAGKSVFSEHAGAYAYLFISESVLTS